MVVAYKEDSTPGRTVDATQGRKKLLTFDGDTMLHMSTCTVTFGDGSRCTRERKRSAFGGVCKTCYIWSWKHDGETPHGRAAGRPKRGALCSVVFTNGDRCGKVAQLKQPYCDTCVKWSQQHGGADPNGRSSWAHTLPCIMCGKTSVSRNLCSAHYRRLWRHGDPAKLLRDLQFDTVYVVASEGVVKFGVTSDSATRLAAHARDGLVHQLRLVEGLPDCAAKWVEDQLVALLREAGAEPLGTSREYFPVDWCPFVLAAVDRLTP